MNFSNQTLDYNESLQKKIWLAERRHADLILDNCKRKNLNLKLDRLTKGEGNCFMVAVLQQLRRPDVYDHLSIELKRLADKMDPMLMRIQVTNFMTTSCHRRVEEMRQNYVPDVDIQNDPKSWDDYWKRMLIRGMWPSHYFIQGTAWYLQLDLKIIDTSCKKKPYYKIGRAHV